MAQDSPQLMANIRLELEGGWGGGLDLPSCRTWVLPWDMKSTNCQMLIEY